MLSVFVVSDPIKWRRILSQDAGILVPQKSCLDLLEVLTRINQSIEKNTSSKETLSEILELILNAIGADAAVIFLSRDSEKKLYFYEASCLSLDPLPQQKKDLLKTLELDGHNSLTGKCFEKGTVEYFKNPEDNELFNSDITKKLVYEIQNMIVIPISCLGKLKGVLSIYNKYRDGETYSPEIIAFLQIITAQMGLVITNAILRNKMSHQKEEMNILINSMEMVNLNLNLEYLLDALLPLVMRIIKAEAASILLVDEAKHRLQFVAASGKKKEEIKNVHLNLGEGIAGWVAENGAPLLIPDVSYDNRFSFKADQQTGFVTKSILAVPLKLDTHTIGVVEAINKKSGEEFTNKDMRMLMTFSTTTAMAIQKARLYGDLNDLFMGTLRAIADAIEAKDPYTRGHSERIRRYSLMIGERMGLTETEKKDLSLAALLHDVGKIGVPEGILIKKEALSIDELNTIRRHPSMGADMLSSIRQLKSALPGIRHHQERFDGQGYPSGLSGEDIPLFGRIIAVVDTFDSMITDRPYRKKTSIENIISELKKYSGTQFDPDCVDAFIQELRGQVST
ncbi:MAG: HD domain-containing phosphohydrolase [bacterium]